MMDDASLHRLRETNPNIEQIFLFINKDKFAAACADAGYTFKD